MELPWLGAGATGGMCPHGPSRSLELWDALKESSAAPFSARISPDGILQLCSLTF